MKFFLTFIFSCIIISVFSQTDSLVIYKVNGNDEKLISLGEKLINANSGNITDYLLLAGSYSTFKQDKKAIEVLDKAIALFNDNSKAVLLKTKILYANSQFLRALKCIDKNKDSLSVNHILLKYKVLNSLKRYKQAFYYANKLYFKDTANYYYNYLLANTYNKLNNIKKAIEHYKKAIELNKDFADAYYKIAIIYSKSNIPQVIDSAFKYVCLADSIMPDNKRFIRTKANILYIKKNYVDALSEYIKLLAFDKGNHIFTFRAGACSMQLKQYQSAYRYFKISYNADSSNYKYAQYLGMACFYVERNKSMYYLKKAYELLQPDKLTEKSVLRQMANVSFAMGNYKESILYYSKLRKYEPENIDNIYYIAESYFKLKDYRNALEYYNLIETDDKDFYKHITDRKRIIKENLFFEEGK